MNVQAADATAQSTAQSTATAALGTNLQAFGVNISARFGAVASSIASVQAATSQAVAAAAAAAASAGCIEMGPYVEYDAGNGVCRRLNYTCDRYEADHYEHTPPTRTSDRVCRPKTVCNSTQYAIGAGSGIENSVCASVTNCTASDLVTSVEATATTDAECSALPGLTQTNAAASCLEIKNAGEAPSGYYWIRFGSAVHQTYCHMTHEGACAPSLSSSLLSLSSLVLLLLSAGVDKYADADADPMW